MVLLKYAKYLQNIVPFFDKLHISKGAVVIDIKDPTKLPYFFWFVKMHSNLKLDCLLDIWCVDFPDKKKRFEINYLLLSLRYNVRVIVKIAVEDGFGLPSIEPIFLSAGWLEREVWDMFGILFQNNTDLRRILTDYGFEGHPLRKDFPLSGYVEVRYDDGEKRVLQEPLEVSQEYRSFDFKSPWEN